MEKEEDLNNEIRLIEIEISKYRKLLNRAVGNHQIGHIKYYSLNIIKLIEKLKVLNEKAMYIFRSNLKGIQ